jgi:hypothetical protein
MNTTDHSREDFTSKSRLQPRKKKLIAIAPHREFWIDDSGTASFFIDKLRWNSRANDEINEVVRVYVRFYLLTPQVEILLTELL